MAEKNKKCDIERALLILTFFCTLVATLYSAILSHKTINQLNNETRPWIIFSKSKVEIQKNESKDIIQNILVLKNVGNVPAYFFIDRQTYKDQEQIPIDNSNINKVNVIMPNESKTIDNMAIYFPSSQAKEIPNHIIIDEIRINYSETKANIKKYFTYNKLKLSQDMRKRYTWSIIESDFR